MVGILKRIVLSEFIFTDKNPKKYMSFTEWGNRIEANPEVAQRVCRFLNISEYPSFQEAEIDWTPPQHTQKDEKKK